MGRHGSDFVLLGAQVLQGELVELHPVMSSFQSFLDLLLVRERGFIVKVPFEQEKDHEGYGALHIIVVNVHDAPPAPGNGLQAHAHCNVPVAIAPPLPD